MVDGSGRTKHQIPLPVRRRAVAQSCSGGRFQLHRRQRARQRRRWFPPTTTILPCAQSLDDGGNSGRSGRLPLLRAVCEQSSSNWSLSFPIEAATSATPSSLPLLFDNQRTDSSNGSFSILRQLRNAVTLRSGKELPEPILKKSTNPKSPIEEEIVEEILEDDKEQEKEEPSLPLSSKATQAQDKGKEKVDLPMYQPPLPFPGRTGNDAYLKLLCDDNDNGLESFVFDENVLSSENDNDVHDALHDTLDDDDVNDNDGLCDLNDIEFMPAKTRSKERAKKTKHDQAGSSSGARQGVSDLIAPGGRGLPHLNAKQRERVEELQEKGVSGGFYFDYALLDAYGCREEVERMMSRQYWERLFSWRDDTYETLSIIQLGERLGLYTHEETMSEEWGNLPTDFDSDAAAEAYWDRITNGQGGRFTGVKQNTSKIVSPALKMMKLLLNLTFGGRNKNLHKVYRFDLFHLWSLEMNEPIQMACMVQQMFHSQKTAKCPYVWIGPVVTRLCHGLGLQGELAREKRIATMQPFSDAHLSRSYVQRIGDVPRPPRGEPQQEPVVEGGQDVPPEYADYPPVHDWASMRALQIQLHTHSMDTFNRRMDLQHEEMMRHNEAILRHNEAIVRQSEAIERQHEAYARQEERQQQQFEAIEQLRLWMEHRFPPPSQGGDGP
nr:uncharacterized protein LOC109154451 [Ipomoea batatas]